MPGDMTDDQLKRYFQRPDFDSKVLTPDEKTRLVQLTAPTSKTPEPTAAKVDDSPMTFAKDFTEGVGGQLKDSFSGILKGFQAVPDVVRNLTDPTTRDATISGAKQGAVEGATGLKDLVTDPIALATGIGKQPEDTRFGTKVGRLAAGAAMVGVPAALGDRVMNGAPVEPSILKGADQFRDVESRGPKVSAPEQAARTPMAHGDSPQPEIASPAATKSLEDHLYEMLQDARGVTSDKLSGPQAVFIPPPIENTPPAMLARDVPENNFVPSQGKVTKVTKPGPPVDPKDVVVSHPFSARPASDVSSPLKAEVPAGLLEHREPVAEKTAGATSTPTTAPPDRNLGSMSPQDHMFESLMEQLHPEEDGPLPGNGEFKTGDTAKPELMYHGTMQDTLGGLKGHPSVGQRFPGFSHFADEPWLADFYSGEENSGSRTIAAIKPTSGMLDLTGGKPVDPATVDYLRKEISNNGLLTKDVSDTLDSLVKGGYDPYDVTLKLGEGQNEFNKGEPPISGKLQNPPFHTIKYQGAGAEGDTIGYATLPESNAKTPWGTDVLAPRDNGPNLGEVRDEVGAQEAARDPRIVAAFKEAGIKPTADAIRDMSGTPSREPLEKSNRLLDNEFMRHIMDERGSIQFGPDWLTKKNKVIAGDPSYTGDVKSMIQSDNIRQGKGSGENWVNQTITDRLKALRSGNDGSVTTDFIKSAGRVANQARVSSFLSGLAVPKSLLGNAGAIVSAAVENGDFNIIKEAFNLKANAQSLKDAWQSTANPAAISGAGKINVPGRFMGAADQATIDLLKRAGLSEDDAQRLQLQRPNPVGDNNFGKALKSPVGKFVWPFQRTPFNQLAEGISSENWKSPHAGDTAGTARRTGLSLATTGAGYELGQNTKDPRILGLAAALAGVRGVPLLIGAAMGGAGKNAIVGISPIPEWGIPSKASDLARLTGLDPAFIKAYGLDDTSKRKDRTSRPATSRSTR